MTASISVIASAGLVLAGPAAPASAHVELDPAQVRANVATRIELVVEHGCDASPISRVVTRLPAEAVDVNADGPPGWTAAVAANVVTWDGTASPVAKDLRLGLAFTVRTSAAIELAFPTVESCPNGDEIRWIDIVPATPDESVHPVPRLAVSAGDAAPPTAAPAPTTAPVARTTAPTASTAAATTAGSASTGATTTTTTTTATATATTTGGPSTADGSASTPTAATAARSGGGGSGALVAVAAALVAVAVVLGAAGIMRRRRGRADDGP